MKAKLIKLELHDGYRLDDENGLLIASTLESSKNKISLKNCQAIERGYDLDELAHIRAEILNSYTSGTKWADDIDKLLTRYREVIELMGDKKFSEEDMEKAIELARETELKTGGYDPRPFTSNKYSKKQIIQSLQQTEWDVEVEMECILGCINLTLNGENSLCCGNKKPKLDENGCLILKRI